MPLALVPQAGQYLGQTQAPILNNFTLIENGFQVDHVDWGITGAGWHNKVTFPVQPQPTAPTFLTTQFGLYNFNDVTFTGANQLYITQPSGASFPMTAATLGNPGWTYLPSGIIMKWGFFTATAGSLQTLTIASGGAFGPSFSVFSVQLTPFSAQTGLTLPTINTGSNGTNSFNYYTNSATAFQYVCIGA